MGNSASRVGYEDDPGDLGLSACQRGDAVPGLGLPPNEVLENQVDKKTEHGIETRVRRVK